MVVGARSAKGPAAVCTRHPWRAALTHHPLPPVLASERFHRAGWKAFHRRTLTPSSAPRAYGRQRPLTHLLPARLHRCTVARADEEGGAVPGSARSWRCAHPVHGGCARLPARPRWTAARMDRPASTALRPRSRPCGGCRATRPTPWPPARARPRPGRRPSPCTRRPPSTMRRCNKRCRDAPRNESPAGPRPTTR